MQQEEFVEAEDYDEEDDEDYEYEEQEDGDIEEGSSSLHSPPALSTPSTWGAP
jgi:hypothetical protein